MFAAFNKYKVLAAGIIILAVIGIWIIYCENENFFWVGTIPSNYKRMPWVGLKRQTISSTHNANIEEMQSILSKTPNLWRRLDIDFNSTIKISYSERTQHQKNWIMNIVDTEYMKNAKVKRILVIRSDMDYFPEPIRMTCPFAPEFSTKCELILKERSGVFDAVSNIVDDVKSFDNLSAVVINRNGYWGQVSKEAKLPDGIIQIIHILENPCHTESAQLGVNNAWLSSFWRGSDIPIYSLRLKKYHGIKNDTEWKGIKAMLTQPKKPVSALISNCVFDKNGRLDYIKKLRKYIQVDFFGKCGTLRCPANGSCVEFLGQNYKFYLAFENCNCVDYITEKVFNSLSNGMLPIVMGAPRSNYESFLPPNSFIHVDDFKSVEKLAEYLNFLIQNEEMYLKYFEWRHYNWKMERKDTQDLFCRICGNLFYNDFVPAPLWETSDISFKDVLQCRTINSSRWHEK